MNESISRYDADKTGMADYALESAGGSIIGTRCSKTYKKGMSQVSVFGIPLWYATNSPRTVIQPGNLPGQCWPFSGSVGYLVVQLATRIHVTTVSIEHVSKIITTFGGIESAPKEFAVVGLSDSQDVEGTILGNFTYNKDGLPLQYFDIPVEHHSSSYLFVELRVYSNHGNDNYTCLYRFRVHGKPDLKS
ncbi:hypothetical protein HELRODRAFT_100939 [Helobdella robusta]|uniref:SUN domain-containing protein n=1 Tax=Helobdella robusta TaxID=6412 RepID=T1ED22_HELRO|nr:hypothetical protein HELRODRAFT_100939 [Helobdella robusta]ESO00964.1 hypothetical protein HELRODRAFT_100939 [Helobdella robusta]